VDRTTPLISVIIPSYNHAKYVADTVRSVCHQERDGFDIEVIVLDDGSTDNSVEVLKLLKESGECDFKLVIKSNEGLCRTLNRGIVEHATGQYITLIASDDMWVRDKLLVQFRLLQQNPNCRLCFSNSATLGARESARGRAPFLAGGWVKSKLTLINFIPGGTVMYERPLFDEIGGYDTTGLKLEDWDFLLRASNVTPFCYSPRKLLLYRVHDEGALIGMRRSGALFAEKMKVLQKNRAITSATLRFVSRCIHFTLDCIIRPIRYRLKATTA
jgi:alpha-1,3-rhamnosyltransferase